jgi:hypothetical protein
MVSRGIGRKLKIVMLSGPHEMIRHGPVCRIDESISDIQKVLAGRALA